MSSVLARTSGGGISKRSNGPRLRVDREGDIDMDAPSKGSGGGRRNNNRNGPGGKKTRGGKNGQGGVRKQSGSGAGRDTRRDPAGTRNGRDRPGRGGSLVPVKISGWKVARGASAESLAKYLEGKTKLRFTKTNKQGDNLILYVPPKDVEMLLSWDNCLYCGVHIRIESDLNNAATDSVMAQATPQGQDTVNTKVILQTVLNNRTDLVSKFLDLSNLGNDPLLKQNGFFDLGSTTSKMFPALMMMADMKYPSVTEKKAIESITLANNNLHTVHTVTSLAQTFPHLKNLTLENNKIATMKALEPWKHKFRYLEQLVLTGNPITEVPGYREAIIRRFPMLFRLDNIDVVRKVVDIGDPVAVRREVRHPEANDGPLDTAGKPILPLKMMPNLINDAAGMVPNFLADFFTKFDHDRDALLQTYYTPQSSFSININTSAPRIEELGKTRQFWDNYLSVSRNLTRLRGKGDMFERIQYDLPGIKEMWTKIPETRHDIARQELWNFDAFPVQVRPGLEGMMIVVHGEFDEASKVSDGPPVIKRSFDRSILCAPDGMGGWKVANDMLTVRSYAGHQGWAVGQEASPAAGAQVLQPAPNFQTPVAVTPTLQQPPQQIQQPVVQQPVPVPTAAPIIAHTPEQKIQLLSEKSRLKPEFAKMCLENSNWDLAAAWETFVSVKQRDGLGPEAFFE